MHIQSILKLHLIILFLPTQQDWTQLGRTKRSMTMTKKMTLSLRCVRKAFKLSVVCFLNTVYVSHLMSSYLTSHHISSLILSDLISPLISHLLSYLISQFTSHLISHLTISYLIIRHVAYDRCKEVWQNGSSKGTKTMNGQPVTIPGPCPSVSAATRTDDKYLRRYVLVLVGDIPCHLAAIFSAIDFLPISFYSSLRPFFF